MRYLAYLIVLLIFAHCGGPEPRKPVKVRTGSFLKESVKRNKELLAAEEKMIAGIIAADSLHKYESSDFGAWYYLVEQVETDLFR